VTTLHSQNVGSWGGLAARPDAVLAPVGDAVVQLPAGRWLPYGNGRSYGDSCLLTSGTLIDMRGKARVLAFDRDSGVIRAEAGLLLGDLVRMLHGTGWFPPVLPGTQHVTLAGAIANDIHGKNHHGAGTLGRHVRSLTLLRSDGTTRRCAKDENGDLFAATIGGMGLTGLILDAEIALTPAASQDVMQEATPLASLGDFFRLAPDAETRSEYVVAWIDSLASGAKLGRGVLLSGRHWGGAGGAPLPSRPRLTVPFTPPLSLVNRPGLTVFNALYRWRALAKAGPGRISPASFFFPLDAVGHWNRLYGPRGLRQHQTAIPLHDAERTVSRMLEAATAAGHGSLLTVLKLFGDLPSPGLLSFPRPGVTLTLDFANAGAATDRLLSRLDELALAAGGRVNPYKDARMSRAVFEASFPESARFKAFVDPDACSDFALRVGLVG
jgi:FAD/FMN-containing dehydrogenase